MSACHTRATHGRRSSPIWARNVPGRCHFGPFGITARSERTEASDRVPALTLPLVLTTDPPVRDTADRDFCLAGVCGSAGG